MLLNNMDDKVVAVFDAHMDSMIPQPEDLPLLKNKGDIIKGVIRSLECGCVYPTFGSPKTWYFTPAVFKQSFFDRAVLGIPESEFITIREDEDKRIVAKNIDPSTIGWLHVCADAFEHQVWDNAAETLSPEGKQRWSDNPEAPVFANECSNLKMEELDSYIRSAVNLRHLGLYHASCNETKELIKGRTKRIQQENEEIVKYNHDLLEDRFGMISRVAKHMYDTWNEASGKDAEILAFYSDYSKGYSVGDGVDFGEEIQKAFGHKITKVFKQGEYKKYTLTVTAPDGGKTELSTLDQRIRFTQENSEKRIFAVTDDHGYANLTLPFRY